MSNPLLNVKPRNDWMMPTPFVLNDAILIQQKIKRYVPPVKPLEPVVPVDSLAVSKDTLKPAVVKPE